MGKLALVGAISLLFFLSGCASLDPKGKSASNTSSTSKNYIKEDSSKAEPIVSRRSEESPSAKSDRTSWAQSPKDIENLTIEEVIRIEEPNSQNLYDNSRYDFPITINSRVEGWIDYFTGRGRPHMERYLSRSSRYISAMKKIFKNASLPEDLVYLALIESGFNMRAKSRARAVGPWQFMKATGKKYGLRVDAWIDERRDPFRSTEAAAKYLKDLYLMFESWYLAASAYNAGEYKILRAIENLKTNNYWRICETRLIRRETKDYIPKLIAAAIIAKNPARYGFEEVVYQEPLEFETVTIDFPMQLGEIAKLLDTTVDEIEDLNPELRRGMVPPGSNYGVRVPVGSRALVERAVASIRTRFAKSELPAQYTVRAGDNLNSLARKFHVSKNELANSNNISPREKLSPGSSIIIPGKMRSAPRVAQVRRESGDQVAAETGEGFIIHIVRRGESLWSISEKYNVTVHDIFRWNHLKRSAIHPGRRLRIKSDSGSGEASLKDLVHSNRS